MKKRLQKWWIGWLAFLLLSSQVQAQYCTTGVGPTSTADSNVESVDLNGDAGSAINYVGCPGVTGVEDQTALSANLTAGSPYTAVVQFGTCGGNFAGVGEAWIDWDQSGTFEASESIGTWTGTPPVAASNFAFTVPAGAINGTTRMRVMQREGGTLPLNPCGGFNWGSVVDFNVVVSGGVAPPSCLPPLAASLALNAATPDGGTFSWGAVANATSGYVWTVVAQGAPPATAGAAATGTTGAGVTTATATGLSPQTTYDFYVRADCGATDGQSAWQGPLTFTTACAVVTGFPYTQTFDGLTPNNAGIFACITTNNIADCWSNDAANTNNWTARSAATGTGGTGPAADHTGGGNYIFLESSSCFNNASTIYTPFFNFTGITPRLKFWYHMFGATTGSLSISASSDGGATWSAPLFSVSGNQGDQWVEVQLDLFAYANASSVVFRFIGTTGTSFTSDMAIDDFSLEAIPADPVIALDQAGTVIPTGGTSNFGTLALPVNTTRNYTITNEGINPLIISGISLANGADYSLVGLPTFPLSIVGGATATFGVNLTATFASTYTDVVTIASNATNTANFTLNLTAATAASFYTEDFEGQAGPALPAGWTTADVTTGANEWVVGDAATAMTNRSLYISNDNNVSHAYTINSTSRTRAISPLLDANGYTNLQVAFDFICNGEGTATGTAWDYGRLFYATSPAGPFLLIPGSSNTPDNVNNKTGAQFSPFLRIEAATRYSINLPAALDGTQFYLVWRWDNDGSIGNQPPFAIDNIVVSGTPTPPPAPTISGNTNICEGQGATLTAAAAGATDYLWMPGNISGANPTLNPTTTTVYTVRSIRGQAISAPVSVTVTVNPAPTASLTVAENSAGTANDGLICAGDNVTLTASGGTGFAWSTGANTASITVNPNATTNYSATVTDANGCTSTPTSTLIRTDPNITFSSSGTVCVGQPFTLTAVAVGASATSYLWNTGATTASIQPTPVSATPTTFSVTVTTSLGCTGFASTTPAVAGSCSSTGGGFIPAPLAPRDLTATATSTTAIQLRWTDISDNELEYLIYRTQVTQTRTPTLIATLPFGSGVFTYLDSGLVADNRYRYYVIARGVAANSRSNEAEDATFPIAPSVVSVADGCAGGTATITVSGPQAGGRFFWYTSPTGGDRILDIDGTVFDKPTYTARRTTADTAFFYVTSVGVKYESTPRTAVRVIFGALPTAKIEGMDVQRSCDATITLTAEEVPGATYAWTVNGASIGTGRTITGTQAGEYRVTVTQGICANTSEPVRAILNYAPTVRLNSSDNVTFCEQGTLSVQPIEGAIYGWTRNGQNAGVTGPEITVTESGRYVALVTLFGCVGQSVPVNVTIDQPFRGTMTLEATDRELCPGEQATFTATAIPGATYTWTRDGVRVQSGTRNTLTSGAPGVYRVTAQLNTFCGSTVTSNDLSVRAFDVPALRISRTETQIVLETADGSTFSGVTWFFNGDLAPQYNNQSSITPAEEGVYWASVTFPSGCSALSSSFRFFARNEGGGLPTGTEEEIGLTLYPNPTTGTFNVQIPSNWMGALELTITNTLGQVMTRQMYASIESQDMIRLDLSAFAAGTYMVQLRTADGLFVERVVKQ
ncbi:MAG: GEVED domain-containing protein [Bernardetiaceae bacterium]